MVDIAKIPVSRNLPKTLKDRYGIVLDAISSTFLRKGYVFEYNDLNKFIRQYYSS